MKLFVGILFLLVSFNAQSQMEPFLLLEKPGKIKSRVRYHSGTEIRWRFWEDDRIQTATIESINDSSFTTSQGLIVPYSEIEMVIRPARGVVRGIGSMAFYAIPPIIVFDAANNIFNTGRTPVVSSEAWAISGVFASITLLSWMIPTIKKRKLDKKWRLIPIIH